MKATITVEFDAPSAMIGARDKLNNDLEEIRRSLPDGVFIMAPDFHAFARTNSDLSAFLPKAEAQLLAAFKKLGMKPTGSPDVHMMVHGGWTGPVKFKYQMQGE